MSSLPPPTPARVHLPGLDHLRALAISSVWLFHYRIFEHPAWLTDSPIRFGWTGVDLFFVLSGYLITAHLLTEIQVSGRISFQRFFLKRSFRILPAYLTLVALYFLVPAFHERESLSPLWKFLTFTQNFGLDLRSFGTFSHAWSLCIEEQFYLLLPLVVGALLSRRLLPQGIWLLPLLALSGLAARWWCWQQLVYPLTETPDGRVLAWYEWVYYPTYSRLDGLLVGVAIACLSQFRPALLARLTKHGNAWLLGSGAVLTASYFLCQEQDTWAATVFGFPLVALGYGALVVSALSPTSVLYRYTSGLTARLATLSYALYLSHKGLIHLTQQVAAACGVAQDSNLMLALCLVVCLSGAGLLHVLIEKPFLRLRDRIMRRPTPTPTLVAVES